MTTTRGHHLIGTTLGACILERLIGYGGSSAVFLAQQQMPERKVAIKVFLPRSGMSLQMQRDFYRRFLHEAEVASQLDHPHILPIYGYGEQNGLPYIIMPYMAGGTLSEYIARHEPLSLEEVCWFLGQISSALDYAHERGYIHCDIKPANMLLDADERVMLSDFGIAYVQQTDDTTLQPGKDQDIHRESLMGTPDYISPEQALGETLTTSSDIYSLGVTLFYMLAKQLPFKADTTLALALMHIHEDPPSLALLRMDITPEIDRTVRKALAKQPEERYATAGAFYAAFTEAVTSSRNKVTGEPRVLAQTGQRALMPEEDTSEPRLIAAQPRVHVRPDAQTRTRRLLRWLIPVTLLLLLIGISTGLLLNHIPTHSSRHSQPTAVSNRLTTQIQTNQLADRQNWPTSSTFFFKQQYYYILNTSAQDVALALYANHEYSDFRLSVTLAEVQGPHDGADYYGVVFRSSNNQSHYYLFEIITSSNTPQFAFWRYDGQWKLITSGSTPALHPTSASNTITIEARGNTFSFSINGQSLGQPVTDTSKMPLSSGAIGLYVEDEGSEVAFSNLYIEPLQGQRS
jgi:serine/threonine protein kinase